MGFGPSFSGCGFWPFLRIGPFFSKWGVGPSFSGLLFGPCPSFVGGGWSFLDWGLALHGALVGPAFWEWELASFSAFPSRGRRVGPSLAQNSPQEHPKSHHGFLKIEKFKSRPVKEKDRKKRKNAWEGPTRDLPAEDGIGPNPESLANFRAVPGRQKKKKTNSAKNKNI